MGSVPESLRRHSVVVADTGDLDAVARRPEGFVASLAPARPSAA